MGLNQQFNLHLFYLDIFILNQELKTILYNNKIFCFKGIILNQELLAI